ncbi:FAD-dependent oxidoreductase [Streptacidiphilus cavernicola]|uniref:FAD-dependent oxidoreductase n=1 Tax=Streptacidiphilus cavernicola TaxID=3342716 RepID=A0ABV6VPL1_9ACTN
MTTQTPTGPEQNAYDVVVIGGGPAGLSGALTLGRARRSVLVVDAGQPRNAPADGIHGYLGREGAPPGELLADGRAEAAGYGAEILAGAVTDVERRGDDGFRVVLDGGGAVLARRLLLATGLLDELPELPGLAERWGRQVLHCPYCHGWEVRDQSVGVLGTGPMSVHQALLWRQWAGGITLFLHTGPEPSDEEFEQLAARGVSVVDGEVVGLEPVGDGSAGLGVRLAGGKLIELQALAVAPKFTARGIGLLAGLGLAATDLELGGQVVGSHLLADPTGATAAPGVWVAGNATGLHEQVIGSAAAGVRAAAAINGDLVAEDTRRAVALRRRSGAEPFSAEAEREVCERVLGDRRHGLPPYPGDPAGPGDRADTAASEGPVASADPADASPATAEEFWDTRYRTSERIWSGEPNGVLVREAAPLAPGRALDLGCGEGADAVWLARQGWRVTAVDVSGVALERGARHAEEHGVADLIDWQRHDLAETFPDGAFELVSAQFLHSEQEFPRDRILRSAAAAVVPGGILLIVGHARRPAADDHHAHLELPSPEQVLAGLDLPPDAWEVLRSEEHRRTVTNAEGQPAPGTDNTLQLRRRVG